MRLLCCEETSSSFNSYHSLNNNMQKHSLKDWVLATRPWSFPASSMPVLVTLVWLWSAGYEVQWWFGVWALVNIVFVHAAGNVWSDIADYRSGVDADDTYGVRSLVDRQFTPQEFQRLSLGLNLVAVLMGLGLVALTGVTLLYIGMAGILLSLCYPRLKYAALGDLVIILCYAFLPMVGTSFIASGAIRWEVLWLAVPVGSITVAILHVNNTRDIETDRRADIHTLAMLTGRPFAAYVYVFEVLMPYAWMVALVLTGFTPWTALLAVLSLPVALKNARTMLAYRQQGLAAIARLDEGTAQLQLLFSLLLTAGLALSLLLH